MTDQNSQQNGDLFTLAGEIEIFLKTAGGGQSPATARTYKAALEQFKTYLTVTQGWSENHPVAALTPDIMQEFPGWLARQTYQPDGHSAPRRLSESSRSLYLTAASRFLRSLLIRKRLPAFDYADYDRIKEELARATHVKQQPIEQKIPPEAVVTALVEAASVPPELPEKAKPVARHKIWLTWKRNLAIILALKSSGMRVGELVALMRKDLDYERQGAWVIGKGRKNRFVAFNQEAWMALHDYLQERHDEALMGEILNRPLFCRHNPPIAPDKREPITVRTVQRLIEDLSRRANVAARFNLSPHSLRHYFANELLEATDGQLVVVQEALGHQDPKTTRIYTAADTTANIIAAVKKIESKKMKAKSGKAKAPKKADLPDP